MGNSAIFDRSIACNLHKEGVDWRWECNSYSYIYFDMDFLRLAHTNIILVTFSCRYVFIYVIIRLVAVIKSR